MECFHSRGQHLCKFIGTRESVCIRKEFNSHRTGLGHQHGRRFIVLGHQYGRRDVMWKHSIRSRRMNWWSGYSATESQLVRYPNRKTMENNELPLFKRTSLTSSSYITGYFCRKHISFVEFVTVMTINASLFLKPLLGPLKWNICPGRLLGHWW